ncbi:MAG: acyl-CoA/acyl-ACP dehydrogenase [Acidimicrobiales bacterium]|nr:acyl-CoA/acyl-ACP dehydrogenase [Acidimicrobiales bacterium]
MDFSFTTEQLAVQELAARILGDSLTHERLRELTDRGEHIDAGVWQHLAEAGLVGIGLPEAHGGAGQGFVAIMLVLEQIGRHVAPVPYYASVVLGALPVARFGTDAQQAALLPGVVDGSLVLTGAYQELGADAHHPSATATQAQGGAWTISGQKDFVPAGLDAHRLVVSARTGDGVALFLVDPSVGGTEVIRQDTTTGIPEARITFDAAPAELLAAGQDALDWVLDHAMTALCAMGVGVFDRELRMTAEYTSTRKQFDKPLASFQAVGQRAADAFIDTEAIRLTTWQAAWRLEQNLPASTEVTIAKYWLAEGGQRVAAAAQHLHGGIGVDRDYPLHRYYLWAKWLQLALGSASDHLQRLGASMA